MKFMIGFGKESPFLPGRLRDEFNALSYSKKEQFEHIADEIFSHFHQAGDVMGINYLLNQIIVQRNSGAIELLAGEMEPLLVRSNYSMMIKVRDLETIKELIERDEAFLLGGIGSGTRYRSGLSHAANEAALWYIIGRNNIGFTESNFERASADGSGKMGAKVELFEQDKVIELDQWMPIKIFIGLLLLFVSILVIYVKMEPVSSRMPTPVGAPYQNSKAESEVSQVTNAAETPEEQPQSVQSEPLAPPPATNPSIGPLSNDEQLAVRLACMNDQMQGPAAYNQCVQSQVEQMRYAPRPQGYLGLSSDEQLALRLACMNAQMQGPAAYNQCVQSQVEQMRHTPRPQAYSGLSSDEQLALRLACMNAQMQGPAAYNQCVESHLRSLGRY